MSFFFGDPKQTAELYVQNAMTARGPAVRAVHYDEMSEEECRSCLAYLRMAQIQADQDRTDKAVKDALIDLYDELFCHMLETSDEFYDSARKTLGGRLPGRKTKQVVAKYKKFIADAR